MAGSMSDLMEKKILDYLFRNAAIGLDATNVWVGLGTVGSDGTFTELPSAGGYARVAVVRTGAGWNAATGTSPALTDNTGVVTFPTASATWISGANITHFGIFLAGVVGVADNMYWADVPTPKPVMNGDTASFAAGVIDITQD